MVDILQKRLLVASENYQNIVTVNALEQNPVEVIQELTKGKGVDFAFEAVGHAESIADQTNPLQSCILSIEGS